MQNLTQKKKALFIGQCDYGSTSLMRFNELRKQLSIELKLINISPIINNTPRFFRSVGWRFKLGPMIVKINRLIECETADLNGEYDFVWIEKGVFIKPAILQKIKTKTRLLIHYTPDPAFLYHYSRFFKKSLKLYDACITTKSFEVELYKTFGCSNVVYSSQGFDKEIHRPMNVFESKIYDVCFIGHFEKERAQIIQGILDQGLSVVLAGINWEKFVKVNKSKSNLHYAGKEVFGAGYANLISLSKVGLGLLSTWIPEKHTTRTFEIPACGTALLTEYNVETSAFFNSDEVIFFNDINDISDKIVNIVNDTVNLQDITIKGHEKVHIGGYSYSELMADLIDKVFKIH
jgi:spore maturation protein CgeB